MMPLAAVWCSFGGWMFGRRRRRNILHALASQQTIVTLTELPKIHASVGLLLLFS